MCFNQSLSSCCKWKEKASRCHYWWEKMRIKNQRHAHLICTSNPNCKRYIWNKAIVIISQDKTLSGFSTNTMSWNSRFIMVSFHNTPHQNLQMNKPSCCRKACPISKSKCGETFTLDLGDFPDIHSLKNKGFDFPQIQLGRKPFPPPLILQQSRILISDFSLHM